MSYNNLNEEISLLVLGKIDYSFRPSENKSDAWRVLDWMYQKRLPVSIKRVSPIRVCEEALRLKSMYLCPPGRSEKFSYRSTMIILPDKVSSLHQ
jgi:hypothetical protein